jgi:hypothetical protein
MFSHHTVRAALAIKKKEKMAPLCERREREREREREKTVSLSPFPASFFSFRHFFKQENNAEKNCPCSWDSNDKKSDKVVSVAQWVKHSTFALVQYLPRRIRLPNFFFQLLEW